jgi:hypothetical protein
MTETTGSDLRHGTRTNLALAIQADKDDTIEVTEDRATRRRLTQHIQLMAQSEYLRLERGLKQARAAIHLIRLSRSCIEHSSPDSELHAKQTEFTTATAVT